MQDNNYVIAGVAALALAVLFPAYWIIEATAAGLDFESLQVRHALGVSRVLFILLGALSIVVYLGLKRQLYDHYNFRGLDIVLAMMIGLCGVFYGGVAIVELITPVLGFDNSELILTILWLGCVVIFGILDIVIGALLLRAGDQVPGLLRVFAIITLVMGIMEVSLIFSVVVIFLFPVALVILGLNLLKRPEVIEIV